MTDVDAVVSDLRLDAGQWDLVSAELGKAKKAIIESCELGFAVFDGISHGLGATDSYKESMESILSYVGSGVTVTLDIGDRLSSTATKIENADVY